MEGLEIFITNNNAVLLSCGFSERSYVVFAHVDEFMSFIISKQWAADTIHRISDASFMDSVILVQLKLFILGIH